MHHASELEFESGAENNNRKYQKVSKPFNFSQELNRTDFENNSDLFENFKIYSPILTTELNL